MTINKTIIQFFLIIVVIEGLQSCGTPFLEVG